MKSAAIGVCVHSGWGAVVAIAGSQGLEEILLRCRVFIIDSNIDGSTQPYHYVVKKEIHAAETHLARCANESGRLALEALTRISAELQERGFIPKSAAVLLSAARPLPDLEEILASHALIHTAEGEFFRQAFRSAFEKLKIPVTGIRTRDLDDAAANAFGRSASAIEKRIDGMGRTLGAPWRLETKRQPRLRPPSCWLASSRKATLLILQAHRPHSNEHAKAA